MQRNYFGFQIREVHMKAKANQIQNVALIKTFAIAFIIRGDSGCHFWLLEMATKSISIVSCFYSLFKMCTVTP